MKYSKQGKYHHLYTTSRWLKLRARQLNEHPLCWYCEQVGKVTAANTVDHIKPHKGNKALFFDYDNLQSLCAPCHDSLAAIKDRVGFVPGAGVDGLPVDRDHPFYKVGVKSL